MTVRSRSDSDPVANEASPSMTALDLTEVLLSVSGLKGGKSTRGLTEGPGEGEDVRGLEGARL